MATKSKTGQMVFAALMAALIAVLAQIMVPIGPVPFSMAIFGVFFAGAMLPPLAASASIAVYLLLGIVGLPVFTGFKGGPQVLLGPTGGYLAGYL
ncbi:MAG: biotin transporter BioY, partial [Oscillospiraceae bacterium]